MREHFRGERHKVSAFDQMARSDGRTWLGLWCLSLIVFSVTAHWWTPQNSDAAVAAWPAWNLARNGTLDLTAVADQLPSLPGFAELDGRLVVLRFMGVVLIAVPLNFMLAWSDLGPEQVGALTASIVSAIAVANMGVVLRALTTPRRALLGAIVLAFGTSMWTVASAELWTHGPAAMWLSSGLLFLSRERLFLAGCALAPAILTRSHLAVAIAVIGLWVGWERRSIRPVLALGGPAGTAVVLLVAWNGWYFGEPSIGGSYNGAISSAVSRWSDGGAGLAVNIAGTFLSGWCGALVYSPVLLPLLRSLPLGWRSAPAYARGAFLGGIAYLLVQLRIDTFTGGGAFFGNRLIVETLVLSMPLAAVGYATWSDRPWRSAVTTVLAALSIGIHATGALLADFRIGGGFSDWTTWYPTVVVRAAGSAGLVVVAVVLTAVLIGTSHALRRIYQTPRGRGSLSHSARNPLGHKGTSPYRDTSSLTLLNRASRPLTKPGDSSVESDLANSTASSMTTASGTSSHQSSS